jgi:hypothetical protein
MFSTELYESSLNSFVYELVRRRDLYVRLLTAVVTVTRQQFQGCQMCCGVNQWLGGDRVGFLNVLSHYFLSGTEENRKNVSEWATESIFEQGHTQNSKQGPTKSEIVIRQKS